jgi:hypothetical protein
MNRMYVPPRTATKLLHTAYSPPMNPSRSVALSVIAFAVAGLGANAATPNAASAASSRSCPGKRSVRAFGATLTAYRITTSPGKNVGPYSCTTARRVAKALLERRRDYVPCTDHLYDEETTGCKVAIKGGARFTCYQAGDSYVRLQCLGRKNRSVQFSTRDIEGGR